MNIHEAHSAMREEKRIRLPDWEEGSHVTIKDGELVDENGDVFIMSPWWLDCTEFQIIELNTNQPTNNL